MSYVIELRPSVGVRNAWDWHVLDAKGAVISRNWVGEVPHDWHYGGSRDRAEARARLWIEQREAKLRPDRSIVQIAVP